MSKMQISKVSAILLAIIFAGALLSPTSHAQDLEGRVIVNVPFAFQNGSQHLSAGVYTISMAYQNIVSIRGDSDAGFAIVGFDQDNEPSKQRRLCFANTVINISSMRFGWREKPVTLTFRLRRRKGLKSLPTGLPPQPWW